MVANVGLSGLTQANFSKIISQKFMKIVCDLFTSIFKNKYLSDSMERSLVLRRIISSTLVIGNFLMSGTGLGNADGFELSFLTKICEIKGNQHRLNLLHFVVKDIPHEQVGFHILYSLI